MIGKLQRRKIREQRSEKKGLTRAWEIYFGRGGLSRLLAQCLYRLRGGHDLAGVAQGVIGHVDHCAADGRGQLLAADKAPCVEVGRGKNANAAGGVAEGDLD